jgi:hypothetical protein
LENNRQIAYVGSLQDLFGDHSCASVARRVWPAFP